MIYDDEGFLYPHINEYCTDCGTCKSVCALKSTQSEHGTYPLVYAVKHKDEMVRISSTSGGAFTALSDWILENNGLVFGVKYNEEFLVVTSCAESKGERDKFKVSKYVQSDLGNSFNKVRDFLKQDKLVMFSGTPCQVAALRIYCKGIDTKNLYLCDLICTGTPPQLLFQDFIRFLESNKKKKLTSFNMRYKSNRGGWRGYNSLAIYADGFQDNKSLINSVYTTLFGTHLALRPSCYECKYKRLERPSDITIADFWGIEKCMPDFDDNRGVSLVLINSDKGKYWFENIENKLHIRESNKTDCMQKNLKGGRAIPNGRTRFWLEYKTKGFTYIAKKYGGHSLTGKCTKVLKIFVKSVLMKLGLFDFAKKVLKK